MRFVITVDAEADNQWDAEAPQTVENLAAVPRFQSLCDRYGFPPTYLCTYEVVTSPAFERTIGAAADAGRAEVGAHLHPWTTPPFDRGWDGAGTAHPYPLELPPPLLADKLAALTSALRARTGRAPASHRAGRWGFSAPQIPILTALGYEVDCSVTPGVSWRGDRGLRGGGADFTAAGLHPYELSADDVCGAGDSGLLEVPVTIVRTSRILRAFPWRGRARRGAGSWGRRAADRLLRVAPEWLRPYPHMTAERLIAVCEAARRMGLPVLEMMLHSSELVPREPSRPDAVTLERRLDRLARVFEHLAARGVRGMTLTDFARTHRAEGADGERAVTADRGPRRTTGSSGRG